MAYITKFNAYRIIRNSDLMNTEIPGAAYKYKVYFFNKLERKELLAFKELMKDPEGYFSNYYVPLDISDTKTYVFEFAGRKPAYHSNLKCERLHNEFKNAKNT